jgi:hypothetical protein
MPALDNATVIAPAIEINFMIDPRNIGSMSTRAPNGKN